MLWFAGVLLWEGKLTKGDVDELPCATSLTADPERCNQNTFRKAGVISHTRPSFKCIDSRII